MIQIVPLFAVIGVIIFLGFIGEYVFKKTNIPDIIWLIFFGIFIGTVSDITTSPGFQDFAPVFTTFALIFILFEGSLKIKLIDLFRSTSKATLLTFISFIMALVVVTVVGKLLGLPLLDSMLVGAIIGGTSSAVVIPIAERINIKSETVLLLKLESSISDVLCILASLTILGIMVNPNSFSLSDPLHSLIGSFAIAILVGLLAGFLWIPIIKYIQRHSKSYLITIAFIMLLYSFVEYINASGAIACLAFGIVLGNSKQIYEIMRKPDTSSALQKDQMFFYSQISFFVKTFFFVYLGMMIDFSDSAPFILAGIITLLLFVVRPFAVTPIAKHISIKDRAALEVLIPKGLAAAVLAQLPAQVLGSEAAIFDGLASMVMAVVLYTIVLSSLLVFLVEKNWYKGLANMLVRATEKTTDPTITQETTTEVERQEDTNIQPESPSGKVRPPTPRHERHPMHQNIDKHPEHPLNQTAQTPEHQTTEERQQIVR